MASCPEAAEVAANFAVTWDGRITTRAADPRRFFLRGR